MTNKRSFLKRNIDLGESLVFDDGRITLAYVDRAEAARFFTVKTRGEPDKPARLYPLGRLTLDGGRIVVELEKRQGRQARLFIGIDADVSINRPPRKDEPAAEKPHEADFGGYV